MAIDFTLTKEQKELQKMARDFAQKVLKPIVKEADACPDPWKGFLMTKKAYEKAYELGLAYAFVPKEYGGAGVSNVDTQIAVEEICAVDPGFGCTLLVNGLGLMPLIWWGSEEQKKKWLTKATSDPDKDFIVSWVVSEPEGTANFDHPGKHPCGMQVTADYDKSRGEYVINGRKMWNSNATGWDQKGADINVVVARTDRSKGGKEGLSVLIVPRGTKGLRVEGILNKLGHRLTVQPRIIFENCRVPAENLIAGTEGNGDLAITKAFTWSGPVAGIAAVGVMRSAFETSLSWAKEYAAGGSQPIIHHQNVGYLLADMKMRIEAGRYLSWRAAHYLDQHDSEGMEAGALSKIYCGELSIEVINDAMRLMGINSYIKDYPLEKHMRDALCFPIYDAGNMGMQRRRLHGIMAHESYNPMALAQNLRQQFVKAMHGIDADPGHAVAGVTGKGKRRECASVSS
ncbi:MAG: acyl-CoA dehydrogenase family protein [Elusimicrobia bacterium]|nr:acyl-CoA dehydrogenase family protein [Elusimicrobiota bacterium]